MSKELVAQEMSNIVLDGIRLAATSGAARDAETHSNGDQK